MKDKDEELKGKFSAEVEGIDGLVDNRDTYLTHARYTNNNV